MADRADVKRRMKRLFETITLLGSSALVERCFWLAHIDVNQMQMAMAQENHAVWLYQQWEMILKVLKEEEDLIPGIWNRPDRTGKVISST
jgi:hypothetical protein